jgi:hypothetical protein
MFVYFGSGSFRVAAYTIDEKNFHFYSENLCVSVQFYLRATNFFLRA